MTLLQQGFCVTGMSEGVPFVIVLEPPFEAVLGLTGVDLKGTIDGQGVRVSLYAVSEPFLREFDGATVEVQFAFCRIGPSPLQSEVFVCPIEGAGTLHRSLGWDLTGLHPQAVLRLRPFVRIADISLVVSDIKKLDTDGQLKEITAGWVDIAVFLKCGVPSELLDRFALSDPRVEDYVLYPPSNSSSTKNGDETNSAISN